MAKGGNTVKTVWEIVEPLAKELGLSIWDVRFLKEGSSWYLRIFIDKDGGVSIDDCVDLTHAINKPLDEADPIEQAYFLEVSSPGVERDLVRDEHFNAYIGEKINQYEASGDREFVIGYEESYGYLKGTYARDKDAVVASMLFAEMVCYYTYNKM